MGQPDNQAFYPKFTGDGAIYEMYNILVFSFNLALTEMGDMVDLPNQDGSRCCRFVYQMFDCHGDNTYNLNVNLT